MEKIKSSLLKEGMYIDLGPGWMEHPFLRRAFLLKNKKQIAKIQGYMPEVWIDLAKSTVKPQTEQPKEVADVEVIVDDPEPVAEAPSQWEQSNKPSVKLNDALLSNALPEEKARQIFTHSTELMDTLLSQAPTAKLIEESSESIKNLAGFVVEDAEVSNRLLAITSHDYYTYTHSVNVGLKSLLIAKRLLNTTDTELLRELGVGFFLHDIGKSQVDPGILNKPGRLSPEEQKIMQEHPERGVELLRSANSLTETARIITVQHHEKVDGSGYPRGLKGKQVHEFGQICALGDIYDALTSERSYKSGMSSFDALLLMREKMKHHFDEKLFKNFLLLFAEESKRAAQMAGNQ